MGQIQVDQKIHVHKEWLQDIGNELLEASKRFGLNQETKEILENQIIHIADNFLFVISGEVNAGKSSFVNALLGAPICATSHEICTNEVQKITYGEQELVRDQPVDKVYVREFPADILKEITIVDTPGTNSKELDHQIITERFIPHANLILFIFMTENIHAETAWDLFRNIKDKWGKKVVFVMTKKDMYTPEQIEGYKTTLTRYVENEGLESPIIFATSSVLEERGETDQSGFSELRTFINSEILGQAAQAKIRDDFKTLESLFHQLKVDFDTRKAKYHQDQSIRDQINTIIQTQEDNAKDSIHGLTERCLAAYDKNTDEFVHQLNKEVGFFNLTMKSIRSLFGGEKVKETLVKMNKDLTTDLNRDMNTIIEGGTENIQKDIQYMLVKVKNELEKLKVDDVRPTQMFSHLEQQRNEIVQNLKYNLTNFIEKSEVFKGQNVIKDEIDYSEANIAGGVGAVGAVIAMIAQHSVLDVTGGVVTGLALLVAGGIAQFKKGKYIKQVKHTFKENREKLQLELDSQLLSYFEKIKESVNSQFFEFDHALKTERVQIKHFDEVAENVHKKLKIIEGEI